MRAVARLCAYTALGVVVCLSGCAPSGLQIDETVGVSLGIVYDHVREEATILIQDVSPRVDLESSFVDGVSDRSAWVVVSSCANDAVVDEASTTEVAVIPRDAYVKSVKTAIAAGGFADAVSCDGLSFR